MKKEWSVNPLISVIVPIYNVAPYLASCINSIKEQTYTNLEIILVDDGSTDGSSDICDAFQKDDNRIKVVHKENQGTVSARKAGIMLATGEYSTYVDSDDWIASNMYQFMLDRIDDADVIICGIVRNYNKSVSYGINKIEKGIYQGKQLEILYEKMIYTGSFFQEGILPHVYNALFRTELLRKNQMAIPDLIRVGEDPACLYPVLIEAEKIVVLNECLYYHRLRDDSVMGRNDGKEIERYKVLFAYLKKRFSENNKLKNILISQLEYKMVYMLLIKNMEIFQKQGDVLFPYGVIEPDSKIVIYGAGRYGCELVKYLKNKKEYILAAWVDENSRGVIQKPDVLKTVEFDYVLIAVLRKDMRKEILDNIISMGCVRDKIKDIDMELIEKEKNMIEAILG